MTERFHFHASLSYRESLGLADQIFTAFLGLLGGPIALIIWPLLAYTDRREIPHTVFGFALTKNYRWPNFHCEKQRS